MKAREIVITLVALVAIGVTSFFAYRYEQRRETAGMCPFCDRMVHPVTAYRLKVERPRDGRMLPALRDACPAHSGAGKIGSSLGHRRQYR